MIVRATLLLVGLAATVAVAAPTPAATGAHALVLGVAQDGGVPHIGCRQELCATARRDPARRVAVASLGLVDEATGERFLIDATPDLESQLERLNAGRETERRRPVDGVLLTHAHVGHYAGLMLFGREALGADRVAVHATPGMAAFLRANGPWSQLVEQRQVELHERPPGEEFALGRFRVTPLKVPHRDEFSDTVGYRVRGPRGSLLYVPDVDKWEKWERRLEDEVRAVDVALLDATFFDAQEIPGRAIADIPHPLVGETLDRLAAAGLASRLVLVHFNHTNRLLWDAGAVRAVEASGARVARSGDRFPL
ncbi:MAG: MBL fold metallo-hydrolase [Vicinamibacteria bacterium]|nr:MBL fold metallo-hydrolase [Vicinamibacteria bacterium]